MTARPRLPGRPAYRAFLASVASWFGAVGMQTVLVAWLVLGELGRDATAQGLAQMSLVGPSLLFLLVGGAVADRFERHRLLILLHLASALATTGLALAVSAGLLSFPLVLGYAALMGTLNALAFPTRDAMLNDVAGPNLMRAVTGVTLLQFGSQFVGSQLAGAARALGTGPALLLQAILAASGAAAALALARAQHRDPSRPAAGPGGVAGAARARRPLQWSEIFAGFREVFRSPLLASVMALGGAIGLFFMGPYFVAFPVLVTQYYGGDVADLGRLQGMFPLGTIAGSGLLLWRSPVRMGRPLVGALCGAGSCLLIISLGVPFAGLLGLAALWGMCGGIFINLSRTIFQLGASSTHRARVLAASTFSFMGAGALASPVIGLATDAFGPLWTCRACGALMLLFCAAVSRFTPILSAAPLRDAAPRLPIAPYPASDPTPGGIA